MIILRRYVKYITQQNSVVYCSPRRYNSAKERSITCNYTFNNVKFYIKITKKRSVGQRDLTIEITGFNLHNYYYNLHEQLNYNQSKTRITYKWSLNSVSDEIQLTEIIKIHDIAKERKKYDMQAIQLSKSISQLVEELKDIPQVDKLNDVQVVDNLKASIQNDKPSSTKNYISCCLTSGKKRRKPKPRVQLPYAPNNLEITQSFQVNGPAGLRSSNSYYTVGRDVRMTKQINHPGCICGGEMHYIPNVITADDLSDQDDDLDALIDARLGRGQVEK